MLGTQKEAASLYHRNENILESVSLNKFRIKNAGSFEAVKSQQISAIQSAKRRKLHIIGVQ